MSLATDPSFAPVLESHQLWGVANYMGTSQVARDMELLRSLAGGERLDYLGYSYGTMLGATYATLFPEKAGRLVLDSAENAQWGPDPQLRPDGSRIESCGCPGRALLRPHHLRRYSRDLPFHQRARDARLPEVPDRQAPGSQ
ncbi:alpha/beta fold hydrolase [Rothia nasimurium]|uniref:Alpha/beta fold hydrolase n=1 Tax=Rothia nasimurium TaxID=85336 RepID=A0A4Y9F492_9MICC|nr:alpha/beta fold hydrolase [Rothia nasimurium]MBF0807949.1 alpha/beta fold hydrolase [Rothia nasimurium]TFU22809.1 alpha/beta fold hydrolase [Rothia nasimurium]